MGPQVVVPQIERRLGLQKLVPAEGVDDKTTIDIIAIHGLDTESPRTWIFENNNGRQVHWLRDSDMLPASIPQARIYTYDWNAKVFDHAPVQTLLGHADNLLGQIVAERSQTKETRPLVVVASCFGGLILAEAICRAGQEGSPYRDVLLAMVGAVFLATPFAGTEAAQPASWLVTIKGIMGEDASDALIQDLKQQHSFVRQRVQKLAEIANAHSIMLPLRCFFETKKTDIYRKILPSSITRWMKGSKSFILVDELSACIHGHYRQGLQRKHLMMNKFEGPGDPQFKLVCHQILDLVSGAQDTLKRRETGLIKSCFLVPFGKNENFVGREAVLQQVLERIPPAAHPDTCQRTVVEGLGGIGKTQIVIEAAHRFHAAYPECSVFWVPAVDKTTFENAYREIGRALGVTGLDDNKADVILLVKEALSQDDATPWLLILDNADHSHLLLPAEGTDSMQLRFDQTKLTSYLPVSRKGSILFTTRNHQAAVSFDSRQEPFKIDTLDFCDSIRLLRQGLRRSQISDPYCAKQLLDCLAHLPLAIRQAAAYMALNSNISMSTYLDYCRSSDHTLIKMLSEDFEDQDRYEEIQNPIATTWLISFRQIRQGRQEHRLAAKYLQFSCYLAEKDIPISLLPAGQDEIQTGKAIGTLAAYAFITQREFSGGTSDRFEVHRLVRVVMRKWLRERGEEEKQVTSAVRELAEKLDWPAHETRQIWVGYLPHTQAVLLFGEQCADKTALLRILSYTRAGNNMLGRYADAEPFGRMAVEVAREAFGKEHPSTLTSMNNLASVLSSQGKYEEAKRMYRQMLQLMEKTLGEEHPDTLTSMNNLAVVLERQGKYEEAERMHRQELRSTEKTLGEEHPSTLTSMNNLAFVLDRQGKYEEAERMHRQTLQQSEKTLGEEHPDTLTSMNKV